MRAAVHVIPCAGVLREADGARGGISTAALQTAERLEEPADLVLIAVPAGHGQAIADKFAASDRGPNPPRRRPRYLSEEEVDLDEVSAGSSLDGSKYAHGRNVAGLGGSA